MSPGMIEPMAAAVTVGFMPGAYAWHAALGASPADWLPVSVVPAGRQRRI